MHIAQLEVDAGVQFADNKFHFDEHVNLFIGPNSSGKTSILRMLSHPPHEPSDQFYQHGGWQFGVKPSDDWARWTGGYEEAIIDWTSVPFIQVGAIRIGLPISERKSNSLRHDYSNSTLKEIFDHCYETNIFDANAMETALQLMIDEARKNPRTGRGLSSLRNGGPARRSLQQATDMSHQCAQRICSEVVKGQTAGNVVNHGTDHGVFETPPEIRLAQSIQTQDDGELDIELLSSGIQSSLLWIRFLALQMVHHYQFTEDWQNQPGILLIDEIENHLHPTWQRRVIPALREHFPGLQVFATTHSPFPIAGLKAGQVHLLSRHASGRVTATTNTEDIEGWTADEILRTYMGVEQPTDDPTAAAAVELRRLRNESPLIDARDEEERQANIQELRKIVDRAELSGPRVAENNRFLVNLDSILERHRKEHDLNQERN